MKRFRRSSPRNRFGRRTWLAPVVIILVILAVADRAGLLLLPSVDDLEAYHGQQAHVLRVIDGDTIEVDLPDEMHGSPTTRIRLWGIDCPELARDGKPPEPFAQEATQFTSDAALGTIVILTLESHQLRDTYGRVLAHVQLVEGTNLNESLLNAGLARIDDFTPHSQLIRYDQTELSARQSKRGLWSPSKQE